MFHDRGTFRQNKDLSLMIVEETMEQIGHARH